LFVAKASTYNWPQDNINFHTEWNDLDKYSVFYKNKDYIPAEVKELLVYYQGMPKSEDINHDFHYAIEQLNPNIHTREYAIQTLEHYGVGKIFKKPLTYQEILKDYLYDIGYSFRYSVASSSRGPINIYPSHQEIHPHEKEQQVVFISEQRVVLEPERQVVFESFTLGSAYDFKNFIIPNRYFLEYPVTLDFIKHTPLKSSKKKYKKGSRPLNKARISDGRIYVLSTSQQSKGYEDFMYTIDTENVESIFLEGDTSESAISDILDQYSFQSGDLLCIVRGGGDILHETFRPFHSFEAAQYIKKLSSRGVIIITGIGHTSDNFLIEKSATYNESTPTSAANKVRSIAKLS
jgi:hypothetical protein